MTEDEAYAAVGILAGALPGWPANATDVFVEQFMKHAADGAAMREVCENIAATWRGEFRPSLGEVLDEYRRHPSVAAERASSVAEALAKTAGATHCAGNGWVEVPASNGLRRPCPRCSPYLSDVYDDPEKWERYLNGTGLDELHDQVTKGRDGRLKMETPMPPPCRTDTRYDPERFPDFAEGMAIAADEYRSLYGREIGDAVIGNPEFAALVIENYDHYDPVNEVHYATFAIVVDGFSGNYARAIASLNALGKRLTWDSRGKLTLRPAPETPPDDSGGPDDRPRLSRGASEATAPDPGQPDALTDAIRGVIGKMTP